MLKKQPRIQKQLTEKFQICTMKEVNIILKLLIIIPTSATGPLKNMILLTMWKPKLSVRLSHVQNIWKLTRSLKQTKGPQNSSMNRPTDGTRNKKMMAKLSGA